MRRLIVAAVLVTVLLIAFAGSALADGPYGYNTGYGNQWYGNQGYGNYGGYQMYQRYPTYNYCCSYVYNPCPYTNYGYSKKSYAYGGYKSYGGYNAYSGYGMNNGQYAGYGW
jgi:hypothetical protein